MSPLCAGTIWNTILHVFIHLFLITVFWDTCWYCPPCVDEVIDWLLKIAHAYSVSGRAGIWTQAVWLQSSHPSSLSLWYFVKLITFIFLLLSITTFHLRLFSSFYTHQTSYYSTLSVVFCFFSSSSSSRENTWTESKNMTSSL